ncbi:hypothetical protein [Parabacteroides distasonis]|jgi:hypothetical protein|uniref:hypothetical protein n=1 Tax=Parabacteroides distasonis TaxID=823 RepID=UPI0018AA244C|nr:hypothetical protein [Parabacteroides distasonis]UWI40894.1 MAG: tail assembly chaperone protein [Bacteriophage sp.]
MMEDKITIKDKEYRLGYNLRVRMIYEKIMGKNIGDDMLTFENIVFFYSVLLAYNKGFTMDLEAFTDILCDDESIYIDFLKWSVEYNKRKEILENTDNTDNEDKKKE